MKVTRRGLFGLVAGLVATAVAGKEECQTWLLDFAYDRKADRLTATSQRVGGLTYTTKVIGDQVLVIGTIGGEQGIWSFPAALETVTKADMTPLHFGPTKDVS